MKTCEASCGFIFIDESRPSKKEKRTTLDEGRTRASTLQLALSDIRQALTFWSTVSTTAITALLVLFALGQISLAAHAWGSMFGRRKTRQ
ncbi:hypothetical protein [Candidatus Chloroploca asiatica]|uniref:Uncharacterized protein n=1 Tax=Candidatus Chloroploca asiatica TaxID=1506545 RepID=A0A2H3KN60_9CHLR|nr:hypothetical protein [Candidatus Chloroploca asiatica]PDV99601.1 hypothetical protein A9Q02_11685 [Candidatus Chloroploca asiatica]